MENQDANSHPLFRYKCSLALEGEGIYGDSFLFRGKAGMGVGLNATYGN